MQQQVIEQEIALVQSVLSPDLRNRQWSALSADGEHSLKGHCAVASEALYHRFGGKAAGWTPQVLNHERWPEGLAEGETHWFIKHHNGTVVDATAEQFAPLNVPHERAKGCGFMTREPSRRARIVMERMDAQRHQDVAR